MSHRHASPSQALALPGPRRAAHRFLTTFASVAWSTDLGGERYEPVMLPEIAQLSDNERYRTHAGQEAKRLRDAALFDRDRVNRDGEHAVISHLTRYAAHTMIAVSELSRQRPQAALHGCTSRMTPGALPFSDLAWTRAHDLMRHSLGAPLHLSPGNHTIPAVDLLGALLLIHVLGTIAVGGLQEHPEQTRRALFPDSAAAGPAPARRVSRPA